MADEHAPKKDYASPYDQEVPDGYELMFTPRGIPYLKKTGEEDDDEEAMNEHARVKLSIFVSMEELERRYGIGTRLYYNFLKYLMITNTILFVIASVHYFTFLGREGIKFDTTTLFISQYTRDDFGLWFAMNIIAIVCWFSFGPIYYIYVVKRLAKAQISDHDNLFAAYEKDDIHDNYKYTSTNRFWRRFASYCLFVFLIGVSAGATYGIQYAGRDVYGQTFNVINFLVTGSVAFINQFFQQISIFMVKFEKHKTWSLFRKHHVIKLLSFKMINIVAMYAALQLVNTSGCIFQDTGSKFLTLLLLELFVMTPIEMIVPLLRIWAAKRFKILRGKGSDDDARPEFDVAQEYLELFYRQFVIYLGMSVFPMVTFMGLFINILEYPLDKFRMLYICQKPKRLDLSMRRFLLFWLLITALAALLSWPQGAVWILSGNRGRDDMHCCGLLPGEPEDGIDCNSTMT